MCQSVCFSVCKCVCIFVCVYLNVWLLRVSERSEHTVVLSLTTFLPECQSVCLCVCKCVCIFVCVYLNVWLLRASERSEHTVVLSLTTFLSDRQSVCLCVQGCTVTEFFSGGGNFTPLLSISNMRRCYIIKKNYFLGKLKGWGVGIPVPPLCIHHPWCMCLSVF